MFILNKINYLLGLIQHHAWPLMGTRLPKLSNIIHYFEDSFLFIVYYKL
jgi:hypothetical protein